MPLTQDIIQNIVNISWDATYRATAIYGIDAANVVSVNYGTGATANAPVPGNAYASGEITSLDITHYVLITFDVDDPNLNDHSGGVTAFGSPFDAPAVAFNDTIPTVVTDSFSGRLSAGGFSISYAGDPGYGGTGVYISAGPFSTSGGDVHQTQFAATGDRTAHYEWWSDTVSGSPDIDFTAPFVGQLLALSTTGTSPEYATEGATRTPNPFWTRDIDFGSMYIIVVNGNGDRFRYDISGPLNNAGFIPLEGQQI